MDALSHLRSAVPWYLYSFSALDRYFNQNEQPVKHVAVAGDVVSLARSVPDLEFPGLPNADAAIWDGNTRIYFSCLENSRLPAKQSFRALNFLYDPDTDRYLDPYDSYRSLRSGQLEATDEPFDPVRRLMDAAIVISRYPQSVDSGDLEQIQSFPELPSEALRSLLSAVLTGPSPWSGLNLLREAGFVDRYWPELSGMAGTEHSKEHHPEGDVWTHSLETFRYRRAKDLVLSLALLLHDSGKPHAKPVAGRRFDGHAEIGTTLATKLLKRLRFPEQVVEDVRWLVHKHMFPGALHLLPSFRTDRLMASPLFPTLLELYRCDLESSFRGPEKYYKACKIYRAYLKNMGNPFRDSAGNKLRLYVD